jgi:hypothetical protein
MVACERAPASREPTITCVGATSLFPPPPLILSNWQPQPWYAMLSGAPSLKIAHLLAEFSGPPFRMTNEKFSPDSESGLNSQPPLELRFAAL